MVIVVNPPVDNRIVFKWMELTGSSLTYIGATENVQRVKFTPTNSYFSAHGGIHGNQHVNNGNGGTLGYWNKSTTTGYAQATITDLALGAGKWFIDLVGYCSSATNDFTIFEFVKDANNYFGLYRTYSTRVLRFYAVSGGVCIADYSTTTYHSWYGFWHIGISRDGATIKIYINGVSDTMSAATSIGTTALPSGATTLYLGKSIARSWQTTSALYIKNLRVCKGDIPINTAGFAIAATIFPQDIRISRVEGAYL